MLYKHSSSAYQTFSIFQTVTYICICVGGCIFLLNRLLPDYRMLTQINSKYCAIDKYSWSTCAMYVVKSTLIGKYLAAFNSNLSLFTDPINVQQ